MPRGLNDKWVLTPINYAGAGGAHPAHADAHGVAVRVGASGCAGRRACRYGCAGGGRRRGCGRVRGPGLRACVHARGIRPGEAARPAASARRRRPAASRRGMSLRRKRASRLAGWRSARPTSAAPAYSKAAVAKAPSPRPKCCTSGVLRPNSSAASRARRPPRKAGEEVRSDMPLFCRRIIRPCL